MFGMVPFKRNANSIEKRGDTFSELIDNFFNDDFFVPIVPYKNNFNVDLMETENEYIVEEEKQALYSRFRSGFSSVMEELWLNQPKYALTIEVWLKNKKLAAEDIFEGILGQSIDGYHSSSDEEMESDSNSSGREVRTLLYDNIIGDMVSIAENPDIISERLKRLPAGLRSSFLSEVMELGKNDARARNRARQWLYRGLTTVRVKMSRGIERFTGIQD
jgi:hypothetical protein